MPVTRADRLGLHGEGAWASRATRHDRRHGIVVFRQAVELGIVQPRVLDELELTTDVRVEANEMETALARLVASCEDVGDLHRFHDRRAAWTPAPEDAVPLAHLDGPIEPGSGSRAS